MPRNLPWKTAGAPVRQKQAKSSSTVSVATRRQPQQGTTKTSSDVEPESPTARKSVDRAPSTSPPPGPPAESLMDEGLEKDDKYRMVEDEFLSVAQKFTVHLHAAEYKRQKNAVKTRNAQTINSISRPVTGPMPDQTKRRIEGNELAKSQGTALTALLEKDQEGKVSDDSDDGEELPYVGTTLHGLMDSPRKTGVTLSNIASMATTTRSAAGFSRPSIQLRSWKGQIAGSPQPRNVKRGNTAVPNQYNDPDESTEDDLDAPISAPKLFKSEPISSPEVAIATKKSSHNGYPIKVEVTSAQKDPSSSALKSASVKLETDHNKPSFTNTTDHLGRSSAPRVSRFERARILKAQQEKKQMIKDEDTDSLDIIPSFI